MQTNEVIKNLMLAQEKIAEAKKSLPAFAKAMPALPLALDVVDVCMASLIDVAKNLQAVEKQQQGGTHVQAG